MSNIRFFIYRSIKKIPREKMKHITKQNAKAEKVSHVAEFVGLGSLPIRKTKS